MIKIKLLNKKALHDFVFSDEFLLLEHIPISRHRALSHINNPRLEPTDILLLLAYIDNEMVGYLGVMPDRIYINNIAEKCAWLSCLWVNPLHRGKQIGFKLVQKSIAIWNKKIIITEFTNSAKRLYDKTNNFEKLETKIGIRIYIKFDFHNILPPKKAIFRKLKPLIYFLDNTLNLFIKIPYFFKRNIKSHLKIERVLSIDDEIHDFIELKNSLEVFKRTKKELNWIVKHLWIKSAEKVDELNKKYYFSSIDKSFEFIMLKIKNSENKLVAFLVFSKRNSFLKMPFCYYEKGIEGELLKIISQQIQNFEIKTFTCFHKNISELLLRDNKLGIFKKQIIRKYLISTSFSYRINNKNIQDGDGDCVFT